jgi:hypothetical protein
VRRWHRGLTYGFSYDYDNFVLHDKYRNLNWYEPPPEPFDEADGDNPLVQVAKPRRDYWRVFHDISLWICSFLIWPAAGLLAMPICNNWAQLFFFKSSLHWYPIPVNSTVLKLAGLLWGLRYAVSSAQVSPSFGYLLLEPFRPYLDILSGPDLDDHFCGVLSAFPLNLFLICSVTYGGVYLASRYLVVSHQTPLLLGDQIMYSLFAVLTAGSIASHGGRY